LQAFRPEGEDKENICISNSIVFDINNYNHYVLLGKQYESININQAYLCYENALHYCDNKDDYKLIENYMGKIKESKGVSVNNASFVILSYNDLELTKLCINSIRATCFGPSYEIIVVDNGSKDGSAEWLKDQKYLKCILNSENQGFPKGCNQGIEAAERGNDILLLNNDTILCKNSLFFLRMGLYENSKNGAAGSVTNFANTEQVILKQYSTVSEWLDFGDSLNIPVKQPNVLSPFIMGFAILFNREVLEDIGYLDERFSPGTYEDNDICVRVREKGYNVLYVKNSFIFHFGHGGDNANSDKWESLKETNSRKFTEKWGFSAEEYILNNN